MPKIPSILAGAAGEYYVAYKISTLGLVAALPRAGTNGVDILVSNVNGSRTVAIQVKTTDWAERTRGRGANKRIHELQFPLGLKAASMSSPDLYFAFVDLRGVEWVEEQPVVYLVPSSFVADCCRPRVQEGHWPMPRFHIAIERLEPFRNQWEPLLKALATGDQ